MIPLIPAIAYQQPSVTPLSLGRLRVLWTSATGIQLLADGVPLIRQSTLYIVKEGWSGLLFDQRKESWRISQTATSATLSAENTAAAVRYELTLTAPDTVQVTLRYRLKQDIPAELEYAMGYLNANVLQGAQVSGDATVKTIGLVGARGSQEQRRVGPPLSQLAFNTPLGALRLRYTGDAPKPVLFDARNEAQGWAEAAPTFWLGIGSPAAPLTAAMGERTAILTLTLGPTPPRLGSVGLSASGKPEARADASVPLPATAPLLIPRPKQVQLGGRPVRLTPQTQITLAGPGAARAKAVLTEALGARLGWTPQVATGTGPTPPNKPEGYALTVDTRGVRLAGHDAAGTLWAAQTLVQLLDHDKDGPIFHAAKITDWPTLAYRGVHLFHGQNALSFHKKLIERVYSRFKLNQLLIQCEQLQWDADPEVAPRWGGTKAAVREELSYAKAHGINMVPLVQSYGHMEWLFNKPKNRAFAEDPELPYAVNITNPEALGYLGKLVTEADDLFGAPAFHAGLDEVTMRGRFPLKSAPKTFSELFVSNARYWHDFHQKRGKTLWMWADMALHPSEVAPCFGTAPSAAAAKAVREGLPKDIVLFDWQYGAHTTFPSLKLLKDAGFSKVVASTWFNPGNIQGFAKAAAEAGAWGALQTTWCGYESKEDVLAGAERRQFTAMVLAAEQFWNGGSTTVTYDPAEVFTRAWADPKPSTAAVRAGTLLRLAPTALRTDPLPRTETRLEDGVRYQLTPGMALLQGKLTGQNAPKSLSMAVPKGTTETHVLLAASHRVPLGTVLGTLNGKPLVYGENIAALEDPTPLTRPDAVTVLRRGTALLRRLTVRGDQPLVVTSDSGESAPLLLAATALRSP